MAKNNNIPQGYKDSPLGSIPKDWEVKRFSELFSFKNGINSSKENYGKGIKFINTMDVLNTSYLTHEIIRGALLVDNNKMKEFVVRYGDILFNRTSETPNEIGYSSVYLDTTDVVFGGFIIRAICKDNSIDNNYKKYCFKSNSVRKQIISYGNGAIRYNLGQEDLSKTLIVIPPIKKQRKIAEILDIWDNTIELQTKLIAQLETRKRALMQQLLTGKKRLKGFREKWEYVKLGDICAIKKGVQVNKIDLKNEGLYPTINGGIEPSGYSEQYNTEANTITISEGGNSCGYVNLIATKFWCGGHCYAVTEKEKLNKYFLFQMLKFKEEDIMILRVGSGLPNIQIKPLSNFKLQVPSIEEQIAIVNILSQADVEIGLAKNKLEMLKAQKKGLMQQLLTGKKRVVL